MKSKQFTSMEEAKQYRPEFTKVIDLVNQAGEELEKMGRGLIFAPTLDPATKEAIVLVDCDDKTTFWATMMSVIEGYGKLVAEDDRAEWREGFKAFVFSTAKLCFPNLSFVRVN